jgi:DNA gyrase subunit A
MIAAKITDASGQVAGVEAVNEGEEAMVVSAGGTVIRLKVKEIPVFGRQARGVLAMKLSPGEHVAALAKVTGEE